MKVSDVTERVKSGRTMHGPSNTRNNVYNSPLNGLLKIFSLNYDVQRGSHKTFALFKCCLTAAILGSCTLCTFYFKIVHNIYSLLNISITLTDAIQMIYDYCQLIVDIFFVFKYGRATSLEYYSQYRSIDDILGTSHNNFRRQVINMMICFGLIWSTSSVCDFVAWVFSYGWKISIYFAISYIYLLIKILTVLDLASHVMRIKSRLQTMGDVLQDYYRSFDSIVNSIGDCISNRNWLYATGPRSLKLQERNPCKINALSNSPSEKMKWLSRCYLLLIEQTSFINSMYGLRILLNSLSLLIDMVRFTNVAVRILIGSQVTTYNSGYYPVISSIMRMLTCAAVFIALVEHCELVYRQRDRIVSIIDHLLVNKDLSDDVRATTTELLSLVQSRPLCFTMAHFFRLNYSFLVSTASVVVTYTIILLQNV